MNTIQKICQSLEKFENNVDELFASSPVRTFGEFIPELTSVELNFSEDEVDALISNNHDMIGLESYQFSILRQQFLQAWDHEYFHYFQQVSTPCLRMLTRTKKNKLKVETAILIKAAEEQIKWFPENETYRHIYSVVGLGDFAPDEVVKQEIERHLSSFQNDIGGWFQKNDVGISAIFLMEAMAHRVSAFMRPEFKDHLGLDNLEVYSTAYEYYLERGGSVIDGRILKEAVFCYFCYFSLQYSNPNDCIKSFVHYCNEVAYYFKSMQNKADIQHVETVVREVSRWLDYDVELDERTMVTLSHIFCFISFLRDHPPIEINDEELEVRRDFTPDEKAIADFALPLLPNVPQDYLIILFLRFPKLFWNWSQRLRKPELINFQLGPRAVTLKQEQELARFVLNFRKLINPAQSSGWCCPTHEYSTPSKSLLHCDDPESFASIFYDLTNTKLYDCVHFPSIGRSV